MASSGHILVADAHGSIGLEFTATTFARLQPDFNGRVYHSNHLLADHPGVDEPVWLEDSCARVERIRLLAEERLGGKGGEVEWKEFTGVFEDQEGGPAGICRKAAGVESNAETLFNVVMELSGGGGKGDGGGGGPRAVVKMGRPCDDGEVLEFAF